LKGRNGEQLEVNKRRVNMRNNKSSGKGIKSNNSGKNKKSRCQKYSIKYIYSTSQMSKLSLILRNFSITSSVASLFLTTRGKNEEIVKVVKEMKKVEVQNLRGDEWKIEGDLVLKEKKMYMPKDEELRIEIN